MHAEAVLLVDDDKPERLECNAFLHQRVRADRERCAVRDRRARRIARAFRALPAEPDRHDAERREPRGEVAPVLLGEDFGRRHQRDLPSGFDRGERGERGDDGLARADVALHQPQHRRRFRDVALDFLRDALLRFRQCERQLFAKRLA